MGASELEPGVLLLSARKEIETDCERIKENILRLKKTARLIILYRYAGIEPPYQPGNITDTLLNEYRHLEGRQYEMQAIDDLIAKIDSDPKLRDTIARELSQEWLMGKE